MNRLGSGPSFKKLIMWTIIAAIIYFIALSVFLTTKVFSVPSRSTITNQEIRYVIMPNDTLSSIAKKLYPDQDWRKIVHEIQEINNITPIIRPGQVLLLPSPD